MLLSENCVTSKFTGTTALRSKLLSLEPKLADPVLMRLLLYVVYHQRRDPNKAVPVGYYRLAELGLMVKQARSRNFKAKPLVNQAVEVFSRNPLLFNRFDVVPFDRLTGKCRCLDVSLGPDLTQALLSDFEATIKGNQEILCWMDTGVNCGKSRAQYVEAIKEDCNLFLELGRLTPTALAVCNHLNDKPSHIFTRMRDKQLPECLKYYSNEPWWLLKNLDSLRAFWAQPKPFYRPSLKERTCRLFPANLGLLTMSGNTRRFLCSQYYDCDLKASHLSIVAVLLDIKPLLKIIEAPESDVWRELFLQMGLDPSTVTKNLKKLIKGEGLYAVTFGRSLRQAESALNRDLLGPKDLGTRFVTTEICQSIHKATRSFARKVSGLTTYTTRCETAINLAQRQRSGWEQGAALSILAQEAQEIEMEIIAPLILEDGRDSNYQVVLFQHDGACVSLLREHQETIRKLERKIARSAATWGIPTKLEIERCWEKPPRRKKPVSAVTSR
jgi:hypothetical protein